jgi:hypothetical protein
VGVMGKMDVDVSSGDSFLSILQLPSVIPRGSYNMKFYPTFVHLYDLVVEYVISYGFVRQIFILPHLDMESIYFVVWNLLWRNVSVFIYRGLLFVV